MSIVDRLFIGKVIKDFGPLEKRNLGIGRITKSILLVEMRGKLHFVFKTSAWLFPLSASVSYQRFTLEDAFKIRDYINESENISRNLPPSDFDPTKDALRTGLIIAVIGAIVLALLPEPAIIIIATLAILWIYAVKFWEVSKEPQVTLPTKLQLTAMASATILVGVLKFVLLVWGGWYKSA